MVKNMNELKLISPMPPSVNHYLGHKARGNYVTVYVTNAGKEYKKNFAEYVKNEVSKQNWVKPDDTSQHLYVDMTFYFNRTDMDAGNYDKCLLDAITDTQLVWTDDKVTCPRVDRIYYDSNNPRIELNIRPVDYYGIFDNKQEMVKFEDRCGSCNRYSRNCKVLSKAKQGFIQKEIINKQCIKYVKRKG